MEGIPGTINISDDILVYGKSQEEHDSNLNATLQRLKDRNLTLNKAKCEFNKSSVEYFGYKFSAEGISPDPRKVEAIKKAKPPSNPTEVRSLLGMVNFYAGLTLILLPSHKLTKNNSKWNWSTTEQQVLDATKEKLTSETTMAYCDSESNTELFVDANPVGLGAILIQTPHGQDKPSRVVSYASRALTPVETRYFQIEREALAIVWACTKFHLYLSATEFRVITDHKPLERLFNDPSSKQPARIERWSLKLQPYRFHIEYRPGAQNPADYISRHRN